MEQQSQRPSDASAWERGTPQPETSPRADLASLRHAEGYAEDPLLSTEFIGEIDVDQLVAELESQAPQLLSQGGGFFAESSLGESTRGAPEAREVPGIQRGTVAPAYVERSVSGGVGNAAASTGARRYSSGSAASASTRAVGLETAEVSSFEASSLGKRPSALGSPFLHRSRSLTASMAAAAAAAAAGVGSSAEFRQQFEERLRKLEQDYMELCRYVNEIQANVAIERHVELHRLQRDNAELAALNRRLAEELARMQKRLQEGHGGAQS
jgi:hypothetical protein